MADDLHQSLPAHEGLTVQERDAAHERITQLLTHLTQSPQEATAPPPAAAQELMPLVYDELRRLARGYLRRERQDHTLQATALVHEAYLRLVDQTRLDWRGRSHFFAVGACMMRRLLVDHARGQNRVKRGLGWQRVTFEGIAQVLGLSDLTPDDILTLDTALGRLSRLDPRPAKVVELRFFAGLGVQEVAEVLGVSKRTIEGDWTHARAWLRRELSTAS